MLFDAHGTYFEKNQTPARITSSLQRAKNLLLINYSPGSDKSGIKVIVESSDSDSKQHKTEHRHNHALQQKALQVQWYLF